jgi:hypothetical protein
MVFNATAVGGVSKQSVNLDNQMINDIVGGSPYPQFISLATQKPKMEFTSYAVDDIIDAMGGLAWLDIDTLAAGLIAYGQYFATATVRAGAGTHRKFTMTEGIVHLGRLSCNFDGCASVTLVAQAQYDGSNDPIQVADSQNLPAAFADDDKRFAFSTVTVAGTAISGIKSIELDFGIELVVEMSDSDTWPTFVAIKTMAPKLTITTVDTEAVLAAGLSDTGAACTHANTGFFLRKRANNGLFVADGTAEHIEITMAGMAVAEQVFDASGTDPNEVKITIEGMYDGTNVPVMLNTATAIA